MDGRTYSIGRDGHIQLDDTSVSRGHAEIRFLDGRIFLRDLKSTNGTYLIQGTESDRFDEGFVAPNQQVLIGNQVYTIRNLLAKVGVYVTQDPRAGLMVRLTKPQKKILDIDTGDVTRLQAPPGVRM